ncbi:MAG: 50S ribosomal protein L9 [Candidatus Scatovivens sp.]
MKVILKQDIKGVGKKDQVINASDGYARNFLLPKGLAVVADNTNMSKLKSKNESNAFKKSQELEKAKEVATRLEKITLKIRAKVGDNGKLFGGITAKDISEYLKQDFNIDIDKKKIVLAENIKQIGITTVQIKLYEGVNAKLKISVEQM